MKKLLSITLAIIIMLSSFSAIPLDAYAASQADILTKLESIQKKKGFVPGTNAKVQGNCYKFVAAVCEELYGVTYDGEGLYGNYRAYHQKNRYYTVATLTTGSAKKSNLQALIAFFVKYGATGDIVHFGKKTSSTANNNTHTFMIHSVDTEKMVIYHSNYPYGKYSKKTCHKDTIYWNSLLSSPTSNTSNSFNRLFTSVMNNGGLGVTINRYNNYTDKYQLKRAGAVNPTVANVSATSVKVSWSALKNVSKYKVEYKEAGSSSYKVATSSAKGTSYTVNGLTTGKTYYFRVTANVQGQWMYASSAVKIQALPITVYTVKSSVTNDGIKFSFAKPNDSTQTKVYRATSKSGTYVQIKNLSKSATSFVDTNIEYGKTYYYKFESYISQNSTTYSKTTSVYSAAYVLPKPAIYTERISSTAIDFTFKSIDAQDSYYYYITDSSSTKVISQTSTVSGQVSVTGLKVGETYTIYCANSNELGTGEFATLNFKMVPLAPSISATVNAYGADIKINQVAGADGYHIYRSTSHNTGYTKIASVLADTQVYKDSTIKYDTTYYYKAVAYENTDTQQVCSSYSKVTDGVCYSLGKVASVSVAPTSDTSVKLSWDKCKNATRYKIQYKQDGGSWCDFGVSTATSVVIDKLKTGETYYFRVVSTNDVYFSSWTNSPATVILPPDPVTNPITVDKDGLKLSWKNQNYYTGYKIYRATSKTGKYTHLKTISNKYVSSYVDTTAAYGSVYYYKIVGYTTKSGTTYSSLGATVRGKKYVLTTPKITAKKTSANSNKVKVSWGEVSGATKYYVQYKVKGGSYKTVTTTSLSRNISGLTKGKTYYFRVKAVNKDGSSSYCSAKSVKI